MAGTFARAEYYGKRGIVGHRPVGKWLVMGGSADGNAVRMEGCTIVAMRGGAISLQPLAGAK